MKVINGLVLIVAIILAGVGSTQAATCTWLNGAGDGTGNWSSGLNWVDGVAPGISSSLVFGATAAGNTTLSNDLTLVTGNSSTALGTVTFTADAPAYTIGGNAINGGSFAFVLNSGAGVTQTINNNFTAHSTSGFTVSGSGNLEFTGFVGKGGTWNPGMAMNGTGVFTLSGSTYLNSGGDNFYPTFNSGTVVLRKDAGKFNAQGVVMNGSTVKLAAAEQLKNSGRLTLNGGTLDLNGFDSNVGGDGAGVAVNGSTQGGITQLTGLGGRIINNAAGTGTNWLVINENGGNQASYGGTITDGATAKVGVSVMANYNQSAFQAFSGNNTYSGGTFIQHLYNGSGGRPEILSIGNMANIGSAGSRNLTFKGGNTSADVILQLTGTAVTNSDQFNGLTFTSGLGAGFDIADPNNTFTLGKNAGGTDIAMTGLGVFEKLGAGTLVVTSGGLASTSGIYFGGGTLKIDAQSGGTLATQILTFSGGNLYLLGKSSGTTTQTFNSVILTSLNNYGTASGGASMITVDANGGGGTTLNFNALPTSTTASYSLNIKTKTGGTVTTTTTATAGGSTAANGMVGTGRIVFTDAGNNVDFAGISASGVNRTIQAAIYTAGLPVSGALSTLAYSQADNASVTTSESAYALKLTTSTTGQTLTIDAGQTLSLTSGGLLFTGADAYSISGGALTSATATASDLIIHQYGAGALTISSVIANGNGASTLTKAGTGTLVLSGNNTYSGSTYITGGTLSISSDSNIAGANGTFTGLTSSTSSANVTSTAAALPTGFGVGSAMLGRTVNTIAGSSGAYVITLSGNANTALTGGTASWAHAPTLYLYSGGVLQANGNITLQESNTGGTAGTTTVNRGVYIGNSGGGIEVLSGGSLTNTAAITAIGQFTKSGPGKLVSTVANTFNTGGLTVNDGTMLFTAANTFNSPVTVNGGTLQFSLTGNNLYGGVTVNGGTLLFNAANTIGVGVTLNGGTLSVGSPTYFGSTPLTFNGGTLQVTSTTMTDLNGINVNWDTFSGGFDITNAAAVFTVTNAISGTGSLVKSGSGTLILSGDNTYSGATVISNGLLSCKYLSVTELNHYVSGSDNRNSTNLINRSGMNPQTPVLMSSTCSNTASPNMWLSNTGSTNAWVTFDLGSVQTLSGFHLWNYNEAAGTIRGVRAAGIYTNSTGLATGNLYTSAGPGWVGGGLVTNMTFAQANGLNTYAGSDYMFNSPVSTRYIQIYVTTNWGDASYSGLSEIRFYYGNTNTALANSSVSIVSGATLDMGNGSMTVKDLGGAGTIVNFASGTTLTITGTNTFTGTISGSGAINMSGVINPAGRTVIGTNTVSQSLTFTNGTLEVDVDAGGSIASDCLRTLGTLDITGTKITVVNESQLDDANEYVVVSYTGTLVGSLDNSLLPRHWFTKVVGSEIHLYRKWNSGFILKLQ